MSPARNPCVLWNGVNTTIASGGLGNFFGNFPGGAVIGHGRCRHNFMYLKTLDAIDVPDGAYIQ